MALQTLALLALFGAAVHVAGALAAESPKGVTAVIVAVTSTSATKAAALAKRANPDGKTKN